MAIYSIANVDVGTYLTVVLVLIVFSEYLPLFEYCFFGYCFPVKFARERIQFLTDHLTDPFLSSSVCVCVRMCMDNNAIYIYQTRKHMLRSWQFAAWTNAKVHTRFLHLKWCCIKVCKMMQGVHLICTGSWIHVRHGFIFLFSSNYCHLGDLKNPVMRSGLLHQNVVCYLNPTDSRNIFTGFPLVFSMGSRVNIAISECLAAPRLQ